MITRFDCAFLKGTAATADSAFCTVLNPASTPGSIVVGGSLAARESIGGHVASKLAIEHFVDETIRFFREPELPWGHSTGDSEAVTGENVKALEAAFKKANTSVYSFGHRLAAGGRMAASLIGAVLRDQVISVGRVGSPAAYLCRGSEVFPFFEPSSADVAESDRNGEFVGLASLVSIQLSSLVLEENDLLIFASCELDTSHMNRLFRVMNDMAQGVEFECDDILRRLFPRGADMDFVVIIQAGPETIFLNEEAGDEFVPES